MDVTDQITGKFSCQRATRRWSKASFENFIDLAIHNSYVLFCWANPSLQITKRQYIEWLAKELAIDNVRKRSSESNLSNELSELIEKFIENFDRLYSPTNMPTARCEVCNCTESLKECKKCNSTCCAEHCKSTKLHQCDKCINSPNSTIILQKAVKRCNMCLRAKDRKTSVYCCKCGKFICSKHIQNVIFFNICTKCHV